MVLIINCPLITVMHSKTYGRNISGMLSCSKEKVNQTWETKLQAATVISFWFCGLLVCHDLSREKLNTWLTFLR